jgi:C4-dicarboxylate transporter/malic acid transport protein
MGADKKALNLEAGHPTPQQDGLPKIPQQPRRSHTSFFERLRHLTWANYTLPMATGGLSLLLSPSTQPHTFPGLFTIGKVVYVYDLVLFTLITAAMTYRFIRWPGTLTASLTHPTESLFFSTSLLSLASIIGAISHYAIPTLPDSTWLVTLYLVLFWMYFAISFISGLCLFTLLFLSPKLRIQDMTPAWDLPIFPFMLTGTLAAAGAKYQHPSNAIPMIFGGLTAQGLGMLVSILMFASYLRRMINYGFPSPATRPAMMIAVGPPSFTSLALIGMAESWPVSDAERTYAFFGDPMQSKNTLILLATVTAVFIWSLSLFFFGIALIAILLGVKEMRFKLNWWALVFPNVGFTIAVVQVGKVLQSEGVKWVGSIMTILLVILYLFVLVMHARAVWTGHIMWEGRDEDVYVAEGGCKGNTANQTDNYDPQQSGRKLE